MDDTIAAISTSSGVGAISIIRVSGKDSIQIVNKIFKGKNLNNVKTHTINYGYIVEKEKKIDEVLVTVMKAPKTFTAEDTVEINCHGGIITTKKILELLILNGCRLAEPGEFTKRAYLNERIDLLEAEAVMDIINSKTEKSLSLAINQLSGNTSNLINKLKEKELKILSNIEVNIDYPEYEDIEVLTNDKILPKLEEIKEEMKDIIKNSEEGKLIKEGINTAIIGRPNVGKSSLLNLLLEEEKAIVTDIEGTTRDIIEGKIVLNGIILNILDTAGIRKTDNIVEEIGVKKSIELIDKSDLILFVLNNNEQLTEEEMNIMEKVKEKKYITIINKCDLENKLEIEKLNLKNIIYMSTLNKEGIIELKNKIIEIYDLEEIENNDMTYLNNARSIALLKESLNLVENAIKNIKNAFPIDIVEIDIKESCTKLNEILGENYNENLLNELFSNFCLGK
ncbi:MAG: tRNA uridine-5-carboxymethylaminomethyl(34) synthesis GTPase MnmE [Bacilli bacterium]|nr:tRNA uridine-5-carboxymethylaminomethyl(34) synthesis GTPase MnmE [Bacilli bacterium]